MSRASRPDLRVVPIPLETARRFVAAYHRHHPPPRFHKFSVGVAEGDDLVGVAIAARPVSTALDDGITIEVSRSATDGTRNANSMLYGAVWRAAKAMGYRRAITYTVQGESGASLRAAGWTEVATRPARDGWAHPSRPGRTSTGGVQRLLWGVGDLDFTHLTSRRSVTFGNETRCEAVGCATVIVQPPTGRRKRFCSGRCRTATHRARRALAPESD